MAEQGNALIDFAKFLFKCIAILVAGIVVLAILVVGGVLTWEWWFYTRHKDRIEVVAISRDTPELSKRWDAASRCGGEFPIFVLYLNNSSRTIEYISINVTAHLPERSTNILTYNSDATSDQIVKPNEGFSSCWQFTVRDE